MKDISEFQYKKILAEYVKKCNSAYCLKINRETTEIQDENENKIFELNFGEHDIDQELTGIKYYDDWIVAGENFVNLVLFDEDQSLKEDQTIKLLNGVNGCIKKSSAYMGIILTNIDKVLKKVDFSQQEEQSGGLSVLLKENVVILELQNINPYNEAKTAFDKDILDQYIYSSLLTLAYKTGVILKYGNTANKKNVKSVENDIELKVKRVNITNIDCVKYYLSAENVQQEHFKYVEYYHVLEYYFLLETIEKVKKSIKEATTANLMSTERSDADTYRFFMALFNHYFNKNNENNELNQLKRIINEKIGVNLLTQIIPQINADISWLSKKLFDDSKTVVDIKKVFNTDNKGNFRNVQHVNSEDEESFCNAISQRIYAVRNYCVHSKKDEEIKLLVPIPENLRQLSNDILLIREIAYALITLT